MINGKDMEPFMTDELLKSVEEVFGGKIAAVAMESKPADIIRERELRQAIRDAEKIGDDEARAFFIEQWHEHMISSRRIRRVT